MMEQQFYNPFFENYSTPFGTPPFDKIKTEHYEPAFERGIDLLDAEIKAIASNPELPTFKNTIVALEESGELLDKVASAFFNVLNAEADDEMMDISQRISPKLSESSNNIYLNEALFERVRTVYNQRASLSLSQEDLKLLEKTFDAFSSRGAALGLEEKEKYRQLSTDLSLLTLTFEQNALKDKNRFEMLLGEDELEGLPESIREAAQMRAREKGKEGWLFNLSAPSYVPFMRYCSKRELREKMYRAYMSIANKNDEFDNKEVIRKIVNCRLELAHLMGCKDYAEYKLKHSMAGKSERVYQLLEDLLQAYRPVAVNEYCTIEGFAAGYNDKMEQVMPWDWSYYSEKLKDLKFKVNDEMTRPYFELSNVQKSIFGLATELYGIKFRENKDIPVYHPEVRAYEVYEEDGRFLGILYTDFFPRDGKQSGAWMNNIKEQYYDSKMCADSRPQIIVVMNFTRPTATKPSLLTFDEVNTFLHEFGHALHGMFATGKYASLSGTNVYRDFVELPSQLMENWLTEKDFLDRIAVHYQTGENIPQELVRNLVDASNFNVGYACCRQLSFGFLDMAWHTLTEPFDGDVEAFEKKAWKRTVIVPEVKGALMSTNFGHIFSGGYSAGYYGYKWAEVLDADAFSMFKKNGLFDRKTAQSFRENLLSRGGTEDPEVLYERFRGQAPSIDALLKRNGIIKNDEN